jgi:hypothetical protein
VPYVLADGFYRYAVFAQDSAGNVSDQASVSFSVDTTAPERFDILLDVAGWTANTQPTANFSTTDATSGVDRYEYSVDGSDWQTASSPLTLPGLSDGVHRLLVRAVDRAGNGTTESVEIFTDTTAPEEFLPTVDVSGWNSNIRPTVTFSTTDAVSAVARYRVRIDDGEWTTRRAPTRCRSLQTDHHRSHVAAETWPETRSARAPISVTSTRQRRLPSARRGRLRLTANQRPTFTSPHRRDQRRHPLRGQDRQASRSPGKARTRQLRSRRRTHHRVKALDRRKTRPMQTGAGVHRYGRTGAFMPTANRYRVDGANARPTVSFTTADATSESGTGPGDVDGGEWTTQPPLQVPVLSMESRRAVVAITPRATRPFRQSPLHIDTTAPQQFTTSLDVAGWTANQRPTATFSTTDATSGVDRYEVRLDGGEWTSRVSPYRVPALPDGIHTASVRAVDQAGNAANPRSSSSRSIRPPSCLRCDGERLRRRPTTGRR